MRVKVLMSAQFVPAASSAGDGVARSAKCWTALPPRVQLKDSIFQACILPFSPYETLAAHITVARTNMTLPVHSSYSIMWSQHFVGVKSVSRSLSQTSIVRRY